MSKIKMVRVSAILIAVGLVLSVTAACSADSSQPTQPTQETISTPAALPTAILAQPTQTAPLTTAVPTAGAGSTPAQSATTAPTSATALDGKQLFETRCSACHSVSRATRLKQTREQWDQLVTSMIGRGAQLSEAEKQAVLDYLAKTYGP